MTNTERPIEKCVYCEQLGTPCLCVAIDKFFYENRELMQELRKLEEKEKKDTKQ